jgi:hypothetical protein
MTSHPVVRFTALCSAIVLGALLLLWAVTGFSGFGMGRHGIVATILGSVFSVLLAAALMGLPFYSEQSRGEDQVPPRGSAEKT